MQSQSPLRPARDKHRGPACVGGTIRRRPSSESGLGGERFGGRSSVAACPCGRPRAGGDPSALPCKKEKDEWLKTIEKSVCKVPCCEAAVPGFSEFLSHFSSELCLVALRNFGVSALGGTSAPAFIITPSRLGCKTRVRDNDD